VLWRLWSFASGLPLGALVGLATLRGASASPMRLAWGAAVGGALLAAAVSLLARWRDDEADRGRHLAAAASLAWLAVPVGVALWLGFAPPPWVWLAATGGIVVAALLAGVRAIGPAGGPLRWMLRAVAAAALGAPAALALGAAGAALGGAGVEAPTPRWASTVYDLDARVATRPLPSCSPTPRSERVLLELGAHPSFAPDAGALWFDAAAPGDGGRRQIHRLDRASGEVTCWTCGEPGNNARPHAGDSGLAVVFETDRNATWLHPDDTDVQLLATRGEAARAPSRRLTFSTAPDERPLLGPGSGLLVWSQREAGGYEVVAAAIRGGHGGLLLGASGRLARGGAQWIAPLAWSPDGRALVVARGNPFAPLAVEAIDPATGESTPLGADLAAAAAFDADGGWLAFATAQGGHWGGALPAPLGFALAPWAAALSRREPLLRGTGLRSGATATAGTAPAIELSPPLASWGAPSGVALLPDGSGAVLGQRRLGATGVDERLVEIAFECPETALAARLGGGEPRP
jgi:hypothetical protein